MNTQAYYVANAVVCWVIVIMAIAGYFLTLRRLKQKWGFWITLIVGWTFLAISNSISAFMIGQGTVYPLAVWLSSFVMVEASLVLLFFKLIQVLDARKKQSE